MKEHSFRVYEVKPAPNEDGTLLNGPLFIFHHGGGYTALTFALLAKHLKLKIPECSILCFDCRGHGLTTVQDPLDLSLSTLALDTTRIVQACYPNGLPSDVLLIGHRFRVSFITNLSQSIIISH